MGRQDSNTESTRLPIWRDANRLLVEIETAVHFFPRYHTYMVDSDLRVCWPCAPAAWLARALAASGEQHVAYVRQLLGSGSSTSGCCPCGNRNG